MAAEGGAWIGGVAQVMNGFEPMVAIAGKEIVVGSHAVGQIGKVPPCASADVLILKRAQSIHRASQAPQRIEIPSDQVFRADCSDAPSFRAAEFIIRKANEVACAAE